MNGNKLPIFRAMRELAQLLFRTRIKDMLWLDQTELLNDFRIAGNTMLQKIIGHRMKIFLLVPARTDLLL